MRFSIWGLGAALCLGLSGCTLDVPDMSTRASAPRPPRSVVLEQSGLTISGPGGYCVDPGSLRDTAEGGFVLLSSCSGLSGQNNPALGGKTAMLTLSVSAQMVDPEKFDMPSLESYFLSEAGRRTLSRAGDAGTVTLLESRAAASVLLLHAKDNAPRMLPGQGEEYWRGLFVLDGRLMTATATPFAQDPMPAPKLRQLLEQFVATVKRKNRGGA